MTRRDVHRWDELPLEKITEMVARKTIVGVRDTLSQTYLKKGTIVPRHDHPTEKWLYVLQGALRVRVGEESFVIRDGDVLQVAAGRPHQAEALDDTFLLSVAGTAA